MRTARRKTVLITGCTPGGIGAALSVAFQQRGFHVFATLRDTTKGASLASGDPNNAQHGFIEVLPLDVTSSESIRACAAQVQAKAKGGLEVLVNNAGAMMMSPLLDADLEAAKRVFAVNVWGVLAVTQAFAPQVIAAHGAILNICSIAGAVRLAWQGTYLLIFYPPGSVYNGSKAAVTSMSDILRIEMAPLGVRVITAMVGEVETQIYQGGQSYRLPENSHYKAVEQYIVKQGKGELQKNNEPADRVAKSLVNDVLSGMSGQTWRGGLAGTVKIVHWLLPSRLLEKIVHAERGVDKVPAPSPKA